MTQLHIQSREEIRQNALAGLDKVRRPYDIWHRGSEDLHPVPSCFTALDYLVEAAINGVDLDEMDNNQEKGPELRLSR